MSKRDNKLLVQDMLESASKVLAYTKDYNYEKFINDDRTVDAVIRNFEIIGEAANKIDPDFKLEAPQLEWNKLRGFRNRIVYDYFGIDYEIVWTIIENDINELIFQLRELLK